MSIKQHFFIIKRQKTFWLILSLILLVLLTEASGFLNRFNAPIYQRLSLFQSEQTSNVVVVESKDLLMEHDRLVNKLLSFSPSAIVIVSDSVLPQVMADNVHYPNMSNQLCLNELSGWLGYSIALEATAKRTCQSVWETIFPEFDPNQDYLLNFALDLHALPKFNSDRLLSDDVLNEQLAGKYILLTQQDHGFGIDLRAPKLENEKNPIYLHAYVAHNIEQQQLVVQLSSGISLAIQLFMVIALLVLYQKLPINIGALVATALIITWIIVGYFVLSNMQLFLPVAQLVTLSLLTLLWVFFASKWVEEESLKRLINNIQQRMVGRYLPQAFTEQTTPWDSIIRLVNQQLDLERSIFLARLEGDHRLYEIRAINCHLSDIHEMRRDYERPPYSDAIKAFGAVNITRPFFKDIADDEQQFIVPLMYAGDIRGFWAMTVKPDDYFNEDAFTKNVNRFANQVGELLFHYRVYETQDNAANNPITRTLTLNLEKPLSQQIKLSINEMEQKLSTLEHVFNQVRSASILFNLFGQVVQTNQALEELAKKYHLSIFDMTALDLLCKVSQLDHDVAKGKLRYLTLHKGELYLPVLLGEERFILNVRTIDSSDIKSSSGDPFEVGGILFEFINMSDLVSQVPDPDAFIKLLSTAQQIKTNDLPSKEAN